MSNQKSQSTTKRRHYIDVWAAKRGVRQADIARVLEADKAGVSRWFNGAVIPTEKFLEPLAAYLEVDDVLSLFRHPNDDALIRLFDGKSDEQKQNAIDMLHILFKT